MDLSLWDQLTLHRKVSRRQEHGGDEPLCEEDIDDANQVRLATNQLVLVQFVVRVLDDNIAE
jgi:hypothetical protein